LKEFYALAGDSGIIATRGFYAAFGAQPMTILPSTPKNGLESLYARGMRLVITNQLRGEPSHARICVALRFPQRFRVDVELRLLFDDETSSINNVVGSRR
jgi:hypothetical protein